jgi:predicted transposase/invertase (TIGR01784 family)
MSTYDLLIAKGEAKGEARGLEKGKIEMIQAAFQNNIPVETIAKMAKLSVVEIQDILYIKNNS